LNPNEIQDFENVLNDGLEMFNEAEHHFNEFIKRKEQCDIIQNYMENFDQNCTCQKKQQDFENIFRTGLDIFDEMDYHYTEFMNRRTHCTIIRNYVKNFRTIHCLRL
jgi:hypothetical protein